MIKDPVVENTNSIKTFLLANNFTTTHSLITKADTTNIGEKLFLGFTVGYYIFDAEGKHICYNGSATCGGVQFRQLLEGKIDSFKLCDKSEINLQKILTETYDLNENNVSLSNFPKSDYYVVSYWQKFMNGKKGYEESTNWMEEEIKNNKSNLKFTFIKINTDLQEKWGLESGKKAKLKWNKTKNGYNLSLVNIPYKK